MREEREHVAEIHGDTGIKDKDFYIWFYNQYVNLDKTIPEISELCGKTVGALMNYQFNHKINKIKSKEKRNKNIAEDYQKGLSIQEIATKYNLTNSAIYIILRNFKNKEN